MARGRVLAQGHRKSVVDDGYQAIESMGCLQPWWVCNWPCCEVRRSGENCRLIGLYRKPAGRSAALEVLLIAEP
jgi:hypothetical protein